MVKLWVGIAAGAALVATVFAIVMLNVPWATSDSFGGEAGYKVMGGSFASGGDDFSFTYGSDQFDDTDGAGLLRAAGPLLLAGTILLALAALALEHRLFLEWDWLPLVGAGAVSLAALLLLVGLILLPIGISANADDPASSLGGDISWSAGLYMGIFATLFSLGAAVVAWIGAAKTGRISFPEPVRSADFD